MAEVGCVGHKGGPRCAIGHVKDLGLMGDLIETMKQIPNLKPSSLAIYPPYEGTPARINNGETLNYQQGTPKQRVLAALNDLFAEEIKAKAASIDPPVNELINNTLNVKEYELQASL